MNNNYLDEPSKWRRRSGKNKGESSGRGKSEKKRMFEEQTNFLEQQFQNEDKLNPERRDRLALELGIKPCEVEIWFTNRTAQGKKNNLEEENFRLKAEVEMLKDRLHKAEVEIHTLGNVSSNNNSTSLNATDPLLVENAFGIEMIKDFLP